MTQTPLFEGGIETLGRVEEAENQHQAVGLWWAKAILSHKFNNYESLSRSESRQRMEKLTRMITAISVQKHVLVEAKIGGFARALTMLSEIYQPAIIRVDYKPDKILSVAGELAQLPITQVHDIFPWRSRTEFFDGKLFGALGEGSELLKIWPHEADQSKNL